ncbi:tRNA lysidine(34) synthetase TilS [Evansella sp. AB-rgal1]|uniref:tRNA lysidine(34) synthetase TilS n=1 Tax=Evansella sp. AB-rgal1 TaxID=3242696 RepID=UPI00359D4141
MNQIVNDFIHKHKLIEGNEHILIAVSGGPDSMALLHFLKSEYKNKLSVAHVEHGLRGNTSLRDFHFVQNYCKLNDIPFYFSQPDVMKVQRQKRVSIQEAARYCRYSWFKELMKDINASKLALAHHGDDQIETILMRQVRGSLTGMKGIPVKRPFGNGTIIRPFLSVEKEILLEYCSQNKILYQEDETNKKEDYQRNRFRKHMLPFLKKENPTLHKTFQRQSEWFTEEDSFLSSLTEEKMKELITFNQENNIIFSIQRFLHLPIPLQRRGVHLILNYLSSDVSRFITSKHIDDILTIIRKGTPSGMITLPNKIIVEKSYDNCIFTFQTTKEVAVDWFVELPTEGMIHTKMGNIHTAVLKNNDEWKADESLFFGDLDKLSSPLYARCRRPGDKISPLGLQGSKKIKEIFIEGKIPKQERDKWPIVTDNKGHIVWVPMLKRSNAALVDDSTERIVVLKFEREENHT